MTYMGEHNQSPFVARHRPLDYIDTDRSQGWDIELNSEWMILLNEQAEEKFHDRIREKNPSIDDAEEFERLVVKSPRDGNRSDQRRE